MSAVHTQPDLLADQDSKRKPQRAELALKEPPSKINHSVNTPAVHSQSSESLIDEVDDKGFSKKPGRKLLTTEAASKRTAQNRAAQRAFRERKQKYVEILEDRVKELEDKQQSTEEENAQLAAMVEVLRSENSALKNGSFTFDMPISAVTGNSLTTSLTETGQNTNPFLSAALLGTDGLLSSTTSTNALLAASAPLNPFADLNEFGLSNAFFNEYHDPNGVSETGAFFADSPGSESHSTPTNAAVSTVSGTSLAPAASKGALSSAALTSAPIAGLTTPISPQTEADFYSHLSSNPLATLPFADVYDFSSVLLLPSQAFDPNSVTNHTYMAPTIQTMGPIPPTSTSGSSPQNDLSKSSQLVGGTSGSDLLGSFAGQLYLSPPFSADHLNNTDFYSWLNTPTNLSSVEAASTLALSKSPPNPTSSLSATTTVSPHHSSPSYDRYPSSSLSPESSHSPISNPCPNKQPRKPPVVLDSSDSMCKSAARLPDSELDELCRDMALRAKCSEYKKLKKLLESSQGGSYPSADQPLNITQH
ncbi:DNA-binding transcription factor yap1 [Dimargaris cristalligena]|nr:DNA-binding transcription factor yap1 [Dimargaris cristalligena]